jgi:putative transposase
MLEILALLQCLQSEWDMTSLRRLSRIAAAMLAMSDRVTMLGISRWAGAGGSYRSVQRFFSTVIPWASLLWVFFQQQCYDRNETYILAGDEVVVTKAGKQTYGLDRFFSSLYDKSVPGLAFFALSLVAVRERHAYPVGLEQVVRTDDEKAAIQAAKAARSEGAQKRPPGRPKGQKTKVKTAVTLTPELQRISGMIAALVKRLAGWLKVQYVVLDGHFGNNNALCMVCRHQLHLISKLRHDSALYRPYEGENQRRKYGDKLDYQDLPQAFLQQTTIDRDQDRLIQTKIYQSTLLHEQFAQPLNVVIIQKINLQTQARSHVILFSSDLTLSYEMLIAYYRLRFQIEFNFRDAKQFWGLEDFMNVNQTAVTNAANLAWFMVNLSHRQLKDFRRCHPQATILDLKAFARGYRYVDEIIKLLPQKPAPGLWNQIVNRLTNLGRIHPSETLPDAV